VNAASHGDADFAAWETLAGASAAAASEAHDRASAATSPEIILLVMWLSWNARLRIQ
jgi:hypothetical protein